MSVVINGMEMPINCTHCPCSDDQTRFCNAAKKYIPMLGKPKFCPLETIEERKKGKWIQSEEKEGLEFTFYEIHCSECGVLRKIGWMGANYCPNCGADMRGET